MRAIILAAGIGSRLYPLTENIPKTLVKVNGKPMLQYLIDNLLSNSVNDIVICTGFQSEKIENFCEEKYPKTKFIFIRNGIFDKTNNMYSLHLAKHLLDTDLILMNADLVYGKDIIKKLKEQNGTCVAVDKGVFNLESMRVSVEDNKIYTISKKIPQEEAYGCSIDVYKISKKDTKKIKREMENIIEKQKDLNQWTEVMLDNLFKNGKIKAAPLNIHGHNWYEIDNLEDLKAAEALFNKDKINSLKDKKIFFIDGDGTLYNGDKSIPENFNYIKKLQKTSKRVFFMTNNTSKIPSQYIQLLKKKGINFSPKQILTPLYPLFSLLNEKKIKRIHLVANKKVSKFFRKQGFKLDSKNPEAVVLTYDTEITFKKLEKTSHILRKDIPYYATHPDVVCPTSIGPIPDIGCFIDTLNKSTGRLPCEIVGKPNRKFLFPILKKYGLREDDAVVIGDRLETDIKMAERIDVTSILVLTGETNRERLQSSDIIPDIIVDTLEDLEDIQL